MGFINFGKRIKNRQFDYNPRFYDPDKEALESRLKMYKAEAESSELAKERIRGGFRRKYGTKNDYTRAANKRSNMILLATLVSLILITIFFIMEYLPRIIASFD